MVAIFIGCYMRLIECIAANASSWTLIILDHLKDLLFTHHGSLGYVRLTQFTGTDSQVFVSSSSCQHINVNFHFAKNRRSDRSILSLRTKIDLSLQPR